MSSLQLTGHKLHHHSEEVSKWMHGEGFYPIHVDLSPIGKCNHRCVHCYVEYLGHRGPKLDRDVFMTLAHDMGQCGVKSVFIAGTGEPFLNEATADAIPVIRENGTDVSVSTNGVMLNEDQLKTALPALSWMRFSILGGEPESYMKLQGAAPGDWEKLGAVLPMAGRIKAQGNLGVTLGAVFCLMPDNAHGAHLLARRLRESGFDYLVIKPPSQNPKNEFETRTDLHEVYADALERSAAEATDTFNVVIRMDQFEGRLKRNYGNCMGLPFITMIGEDGGVYTCNGFWGRKEFQYGNLYDKPFKEIWDGPLRKLVQERVEKAGDFRECEPICRHNSINGFLWSLKNPPDHVNFI